MPYKIETIAYHQKARDKDLDDNIRRLDLDVYDCALSSWASDQMISFHTKAIAALKLGQEHGDSEPWGCFWTLLEGDREVDARLVRSRYGDSWLLSDEEEKRFGRRFIPCNYMRPGRIQKSLGLHQEQVPRRASRIMGTSCAGMGCPISFYLRETDE